MVDMEATPAHRAVWAGQYTNYDISCLAQMSVRSAVALDARAAYMLDWDKGIPGGSSIEYELLFREEVERGSWPWPTRPAFGHVKVWTHRPHSAVLWTPHSRCIGAIMGSGVCGCGQRHGDMWGWWSDAGDDDDDEDEEEEEEEEEEEMDWHEVLEGVAELFEGDDDSDDGPDSLDQIVNVLLEVDLSESEDEGVNDSDDEPVGDAPDTNVP